MSSGENVVVVEEHEETIVDEEVWSRIVGVSVFLCRGSFFLKWVLLSFFSARFGFLAFLDAILDLIKREFSQEKKRRRAFPFAMLGE